MSFKCRGCLPPQPGSQLSYTPIFCCASAADLLNIADDPPNVNPLFCIFCRKRRPGYRPPFSLSINPLYGVRGSFTQGELEGAKPASNRIKCRAKPCLARRAWSTPRVLALRREATIFVPQGGTKITTLFQAVEKAGGFFDSLKGGRDTGLLFSVAFYTFSLSFFISFMLATTMPVRANRAMTLGRTIRLLNISVTSHTKSLPDTVPRKMNTRAMTV